MKARNLLTGEVSDFGWVLWVSPSRGIPRDQPNDGDEVKAFGWGNADRWGWPAFAQTFNGTQESWVPVEVLK